MMGVARVRVCLCYFDRLALMTCIVATHDARQSCHLCHHRSGQVRFCKACSLLGGVQAICDYNHGPHHINKIDMHQPVLWMAHVAEEIPDNSGKHKIVIQHEPNNVEFYSTLSLQCCQLFSTLVTSVQSADIRSKATSLKHRGGACLQCASAGLAAPPDAPLAQISPACCLGPSGRRLLPRLA